MALVVLWLAWASCVEDSSPAPESANPSCSEDAPKAVVDVGYIPSRTPEDGFTPLPDMAVAPLEFGSQASWMLVLSVKLDESYEDKELLLEVWVESDGERISWWRPRLASATRGHDGDLYLTNIWLPLEASDSVFRVFGWNGRWADVHVLVSGCHDEHLTRTVRLVVP